MAKRNGIYGFKVKRSGEKALANSAAIQSLLARKAGYAVGTANAALRENVYRSRQIQGKFARGYVVSVAIGDGSHTFDDAERREDILKHLF